VKQRKNNVAISITFGSQTAPKQPVHAFFFGHHIGIDTFGRPHIIGHASHTLGEVVGCIGQSRL